MKLARILSLVCLLTLALAVACLVVERTQAGRAKNISSSERETEGAVDVARRGPDDAAPIASDPAPQFRATSIPALTVTNTTLAGPKGTIHEAAAQNAGPNWVSIGPSPIPNGQTDPANANGISITQTPVSGRTTAIAIDPIDPNVAYVGTAQGGVYRTTNGGASWTPLLDNALALAVGSVKIDPKDRTKVLVGTGEGNFSGDSYVGVGVYLITGANGASPTLNGPYNLDSAGKDVMTNRCAVTIAIDPNDDNNVFVGTVTGIQGLYGVIPGTVPRRGLWRSTNFMNGSPTFQKLAVLGEDTTTTASDYRVTAVVVDPGNANNLLCYITTSTGAAPQGIWRSTDALSANPKFKQVLDTNDSQLAPARMAIQRDATTGLVTVVAATGQTNGSGNQGKVWKSIDAGATWVELLGARGFAGGQGFYNLGVDVDPTNANNLYVVGTLSAGTQSGTIDTGDNGTFIYSRDGGLTWKASVRGLHVDSHAVAVGPSNPAVVYTGNDGGVWKSANAGLDWLDANTAGFLATQFSGLALHPIDKNFTLGGTQDNGTELRLPDGSWRRADFGDGGFALIDQNAGDTENVTMYHTYFNAKTALEGYARVNKTSCATEGNWAFRGAFLGVLLPGLPIPIPAASFIVCDGSNGQAANGQTVADDVNFYAPMALGPGFPNTVYYGADKLYESIDQGERMIAQSQVLEPAGAAANPLDVRTPPVAVGVPANTAISAIGIAPTNDNVRLVGTNSGHVYTTSNGGPLVDVTDPSMPATPVARAVIDPTNNAGTFDVAYVTFVGSGFGGTKHVWKTTNLSAAIPTWTAIGNGLPDVSANAFVINANNPKDLYVGTDRGVYNSGDSGKTWTAYGNGLPNVAVFDMAIQKKSGILRVATHGKGMYEIALSAATLKNISTRASVQTNQDVAIGGFIVTGTGQKRVLIRAIGPSLSGQGVSGALADPTLELHAAGGALIASNDNWKDSQQSEISATGIPPTDNAEAAIVATLNPGNYTAIMAGKNGGTGVGLVEIYDLDNTLDPKLANISTRGLVQTADNVLIGGFIVGGGTNASTRVLVRAIGPSLAAQGVSNPLQDPTLELHDANGAILATDDNWKDSQQAQIGATGIAPTNDAEAAILATTTPGKYTAIVRGKNDTSGVALVEIYDLGP